MNVEKFLNELRYDPAYCNQMVYVHHSPPRLPLYADGDDRYSKNIEDVLRRINIEHLYCHQAEAIRLVKEGKDVLVAAGTASGKTLSYTLPLIESLQADPDAKALLLFPTDPHQANGPSDETERSMDPKDIMVVLGDSLAARARKLRKKKSSDRKGKEIDD